MKKQLAIICTFSLLLVSFMTTAWADEFSDTVKLFEEAESSGKLFKNCYAYALFPTIGKGAVGVGGSHGSGRVYEQGKYVGDTKMTQLTIGLQIGGQAFSQIIFFENKTAFDEYTSGNFEFSAQAIAVAIKASAQATGSTAGNSVGAGGSNDEATNFGNYKRGMATFTVSKGGLMYEASIGGQKFKYTAL